MSACVAPVVECKEDSLLNRFKHQVAMRPDAAAIRSETGGLTYRELDELSNQYASLLVRAGIEREALVGVLLDRSPALIASLLGIWKAGAAYISLDLACPPERLAFLLGDSQTSYVITESNSASLVPSGFDRPILCLDAWPPQSSKAPLPLATAPTDLAYVLYTSGSTGQPKGVEVCQGGLSRIVTAIAAQLQFSQRDIFLAHSSVEFDVCNLELFLALCQGGSVYLTFEAPGNTERLLHHLQTSNATAMLGTATFWQLLLNAGWNGSPEFKAICGGEVLSLDLAKSLAARCGVVWNQYGPTEATICSTSLQIDPAIDKVTIGYPLPGVSVHVLDEQRQPVPLGEAGELYIGGAGVARGYRNQPELTRSSFLPDPFAGNGARLYQTGDLGRILPDGSIDYLGRADRQVKVRGYRIEVEEIEAQMRRFPGITASAVTVVKTRTSQRLVAWITAREPISPETLRVFLQAKLPPYMLPSEFRELDSLPLNRSGKIDRKRLETTEKFCSLGASVAPQSEAERKLLHIWEDLLQSKISSVLESFFDLGGDSLLAALLVTRIKEEFSCRLTPDTLIENPSIRNLAAAIHASRHSAWTRLWVPLRSLGSLPPLVIIPGLGGTALSFRALSAALEDQQPVYVMSVPADVSDVPNLTIEAIASRFLQSALLLAPGLYHLAGHSLGGLIAFEMAAQALRLGKPVGLLALLDSDRSVGQMLEPRSSTRDPKLFLRRGKAKVESLLENGLLEVVRRRAAHLRLQHRIRGARRAFDAGVIHRDFEISELLVLASAKYNPPIYPGPVVLFRAKDEPRSHDRAHLGWNEKVAGALPVIEVPGRHMTMLDEPQVAFLASSLQAQMRACESVVEPTGACLSEARIPKPQGVNLGAAVLPSP